jgi:hypothetical protein
MPRVIPTWKRHLVVLFMWVENQQGEIINVDHTNSLVKVDVTWVKEPPELLLCHHIGFQGTPCIKSSAKTDIFYISPTLVL